MKNSLVEQEDRSIHNYLNSPKVKGKLASMFAGKDSTRFISSLISAVSTNPALQECDFGTVLSAALLGEGLKLSPSPQLGHFYIVPFNDKNRGKLGQFLLGYKGYIQLAIRSGQYKDLDVIEIREGECKGRDTATGAYKFEFIEDEDTREKSPVVGYKAHFELVNGFRKVLYWSKEKMLNHADTYSSAFNLKDYAKLQSGEIPKSDLWKFSSFWYKDFNGMAFKTLLRQLISKWGIMSIDMQQAFEEDVKIDFDGDSSNGEYFNYPKKEELEESKKENVQDTFFDNKE